MTDHWDEDIDVLVFGSGAGGMSAALFAAKKGIKVLLCEKTSVLGGTTATSGGIAWIPNSEQAKAAGIEDSVEKARSYIKHELGKYYRSDLMDAFLTSGPRALAELEKDTEVKFDLIPWPDYHANQVDALPEGGRSVETRRFDGRKLGKDFELVRPPIKTLMLFGKLSVDKRKVDDFLNPFRSVSGFFRVIGTFIRFAIDLLSYSRGTDIGAGSALIARLLYSLRERKVPIWTDSPLVGLIGDSNGIQGAVVERNGKKVRVRARRGVILATGGFPRSPELRAEFGASHPHDQTSAYEGNVGDGINAARRIGGVVDTDLKGPGIWSPMSKFVDKDGKENTILYGYLDRGRPGLIAVDAQGRRFVNEANSYHDIVEAMFERGVDANARFYFICDRKFVWKRGLGLIRPFRVSLKRFIDAEYITVADTLPELARRIGIDADTLVESVNKHNGYARTGKDLEYGKGDDPYNRMFGDPNVKPNPNLSPIESPPFVALRVYPGTLGTAIGLKTNADAQVMNASGEPIPGLYACGNELASIMRGFYPAGGISIGPAITFAYRAIDHASSRQR